LFDYIVRHDKFTLSSKSNYFESRNPERSKTNVLIYGAGEGGIITKRTLDRDAAIKYKVVGYIDDDGSKKGRSLEGAFVIRFLRWINLQKQME
jgi:FlaA1/EpsC-like NDP-sugar epimerase